MSDHLRKYIPHFPLIFILLGLFLILGAVSCRAKEEQLPTQTPEEAAVMTQVSPEPTQEAEEMAEVPVEVVDECLACHTDKQTLIDTASPVELAESENSGEG
jgi:hypothetical protein